ncbi:MAG TPA: exosortase system-associated protein, TIGR04073 family [bacterium]
MIPRARTWLGGALCAMALAGLLLVPQTAHAGEGKSCPYMKDGGEACATCGMMGECPYLHSSMRKLGRGIANVGTFPGEILRMMDIVGRREGYLAGITVGTLQGVARGVARGLAGVYEVVTFPIEAPKDYKPLILPEFVFAHGSWEQKPNDRGIFKAD